MNNVIFPRRFVDEDTQYLNKRWPPFGVKICSDICPRTVPVPRSEQFCESEARRKMRASRIKQCSGKNWSEHILKVKRRLLCLLSFKNLPIWLQSNYFSRTRSSPSEKCANRCERNSWLYAVLVLPSQVLLKWYFILKVRKRLPSVKKSK